MFLFGKPHDINKSFIVNYAPIFAQLKRSEKNLILNKSEVIHYKKGKIIYTQGRPADAFYCMITGKVKISRQKDQREEVIDTLGCGKYFGIIPLLTTHAHHASAEVVNDSLILRIKKNDLSLILDKVPKLALYLSTTLSHQLGHRHVAKKTSAGKIISVYGAVKGSGRTMYAINLALSLSKETKKKVVIIDLSQAGNTIIGALNITTQQETIRLDMPLNEDGLQKCIIHDEALQVDFLNMQRDPTTDNTTVHIGHILSLLTNQYRYIVVDLPADTSEAVRMIVTQSDDIHLITDYNTKNLQFTKELMVNLFESVEYPQEKIKVIVNERKGTSRIPYEQVVKLIDHDIEASLPECVQAGTTLTIASATVVLKQPDCGYAVAVRRLARQTGEVMVGLALGGGAAFGLAHIGVLKILEKENIPIDIVAGTSMGGLVAAFWASGKSAAELEQIMMEYNDNKLKVLHLMGDLCFPRVSLVAGKQVAKLLKRHLGTKTFQDTRLPLKIVATNLDIREKIELDTGLLIDAVKASIAIPGFFKPVRSKGNLMIDGGILEPVPTKTLVDAGVKKVIAVNVLPSPQQLQEGYKKYKYHLEQERVDMQKRGFFVKLGFSIRLLLRRIFFPNILDIVINSIQTMEHEISKENCRRADIVINPIIPGMNWFEFFAVRSFVDKGEYDTQKAIEKIKELINR